MPSGRDNTENWTLDVTCQSSDGAHPVSHVEAGPAEDGGDKGPTEDSRGSSDLWVPMVDVVQDVWHVLLLCGERQPATVQVPTVNFLTQGKGWILRKEKEGEAVILI